ncbi:MAG: DNA polymerase III subunit alpha, partial [Deltaproteobacteria bacterium]|nr:DNA polymerase III subunit alpha [Deltaproteobacteria bacterium]
MARDFCHLHLHTQYSFLDGAIRIADLFPRLRQLGMGSCAITDHGVMYGAADFFTAAKAHDIKPILGMEAYVAGERGRRDRTVRESYHLVLLAETPDGLRNLVQLSTKAYQEGFYYVPRVDKELLAEHHQGIVALSACMSGEVARRFLDGDLDGARATALEYDRIFGRGNFFLEVQPNGLERQDRINAFLGQLGRDSGIPLVATNDCHYLEAAHYEAQDVLMCIRQQRTLDDPKRHRHETNAFYVRSGDEMWELVGTDFGAAFDNALEIAERCNAPLKLSKPQLPRFPVPPEVPDAHEFVRRLARQGLARRFEELGDGIDREAYRQRLEYELETITKMDFSGYFLIVQDFINEAKRRGVRVGPGRGSGAGSLVAFALRITDIDPIPHALLFERFLNPERISMPDFDIDFMQERRGEVIAYVTEKYGHDRVAQIATYAALNAKSVIKDVARVLGVPFAEVNPITKLIPSLVDGKKVTLEQALKLEPRLVEIQKENPVYAKIISIARTLEGLYRQAGMHAAGVVIGQQPLTEYCPLFVGNNGEQVSQFDMKKVEKIGLVKFDFLGLKTLDVIDAAERHVDERIGAENRLTGDALERAARCHPHARQRQTGAAIPPLDCSLLDFKEPAVYELITGGETLGVFQLESSGFQELMRRLKPDCFEDVVASVALYRPGPIQAGMIDDYVNRKHGRARVSYPHPLLEPVLKPTHGTIVYQEQVMQIAQVLAGYTL